MFLTFWEGSYKVKECVSPFESQSPQIGSMFLTFWEGSYKVKECVSPFESQSPQIGSMFLTVIRNDKCWLLWSSVAIPSNRVNVSYSLTGIKKGLSSSWSQSPQIGSMFLTLKEMLNYGGRISVCRNPLKSGQCFLQTRQAGFIMHCLKVGSQSPQIGSMFLTLLAWKNWKKARESQSPQIGSMFLTAPIFFYAL